MVDLVALPVAGDAGLGIAASEGTPEAAPMTLVDLLCFAATVVLCCSTIVRGQQVAILINLAPRSAWRGRPNNARGRPGGARPVGHRASPEPPRTPDRPREHCQADRAAEGSRGRLRRSRRGDGHAVGLAPADVVLA